jgi:hypothetical protein
MRRGHTLGTGSEDDNLRLPQHLCYLQSTMPPRHVRSPEHGQDLPHSYEGIISGSHDAPGSFIEAKESNSWASEPGDEWPTTTQQSQHQSTTRRQRTPQIRKGKADPGPGKPTKSREDRSSRDIQNIRDYGPGDPCETDSEISHSSGSHSENTDASSDSGVRSNPEHDGLVHQIQRLQKRLASLRHNDPKSDSAGDRSAVAVKPWKVLHEVQCTNSDRLTCYLDEPELESDHELGHLHWQGTRHVTNAKIWIRKQKQPFIVYRR